MAKRIIIISSFPILIALAAIALIMTGIVHSQPSVPFDADSARTQIIALAGEGKLMEMDDAITKLSTEVKDNSVLSTNYYIIADSLAWRRINSRASQLYQTVIDKSPDASLISKAQLGLVRVEILGLIEDKKFMEAKEKLDSIITDFNNVSTLGMTLFHLGQEFSWRHRYEEAIEAFDNVSSGEYSQSAKLWSARSNVCSIISKGPVSGANDNEITAAIDKLMSDFAGDSGLAETLYWIGKEYEWKKGTTINRTGWYDTPNSVYQKIMQAFSDTPYGQEAEWDQKRLSHRMKIYKLMKEPNQATTDAAIEAMVKDLNDRPELSVELYWVAFGYEEQPDKLAEAEKIYERIIKECPGTEEADRANLDLRRRIMCDLFDAGDINSSLTHLDQFIKDFNQHYYAGDCLGRAEIGFYTKATELRIQNTKEESKKYAAKAADVWEKIQSNNLNITTDLVYLYYYAGANYLLLEKWDEAISNFQKLLDNWPDFPYTCLCQHSIAGSLENLRDSGSVPKEGINPLIEDAYKAILSKYPNCYAVKDATYKLGGIMLAKGDKASALYYYQQFLELTKSLDTAKAKCSSDKKIMMKREDAKAKIAQIIAQGGTN